MQGARCGTQSRDSRIMPWAEGKCSTAEPPRHPNHEFDGCLDGSVVNCLPSAQGVILETLDRVPRQALCMEPASPSACVSASLSLCVSHE